MVHDWYGLGYDWLWVIPAMALMMAFAVAVIVVIARRRPPENTSTTFGPHAARDDDVPAERPARGDMKAA